MFCQFSLPNIFFKSAASSPLYVQCPNSDSHRLFLAWFTAIASDLFSFLHSFPNYIHLLHMKQNELPTTRLDRAFLSRNLPLGHHCLGDIPQVPLPVIQDPL